MAEESGLDPRPKRIRKNYDISTKESVKINELVADNEENSKNNIFREKKEKCYEFLDHPADIQIHSWGNTLKDAMENACIAMFDYIVPLHQINIDVSLKQTIECDGHDLDSLFFNFMDSFLFQFCTETVVCKDIQILDLDLNKFRIKAVGFGDVYNPKKHEQGTEVKAITYSNLQIIKNENHAEIFIIVDI